MASMHILLLLDRQANLLFPVFVLSQANWLTDYLPCRDETSLNQSNLQSNNLTFIRNLVLIFSPVIWTGTAALSTHSPETS